MKLPTVSVNIMLPGAAPTEVETGITERIETAVRSITGVSAISSTASEGSSRTLIEFRSGTNIDAALREVRNAIDQQRGELPADIIGPQIAKDTSSRPDSRAPHS
jgi:multidrug efflux pump subunit AcrB